MLRSLVLFTALVVSTSVFAGDTISGSELQNRLREAAKLSKSLSGSISNDEPCTMRTYTMPGRKGLVVAIEGEHGEVLGAVVISADEDFPVSTEGNGGYSKVSYLLEEARGTTARISITTYEDLASFDLSIAHSSRGPRSALRCSFSE